MSNSELSVGELMAEIARLNLIINTPQADNFLRAVSTEAEHQRQRWGNEGDAGKTPADWFWLIGYLAGKALHAHASGDIKKAEHHVITTAAACANWHEAMLGRTDMRPGIDGNSELTGETAKPAIYYMPTKYQKILLSWHVPTAMAQIETAFNSGYTRVVLRSRLEGFPEVEARGPSDRLRFFAECERALNAANSRSK